MVMTGRCPKATPQLPDAGETLKGHPKYQRLTVLIPTLTVYFCLAFYRLDHQSLWVDEVFSLRRANPEGTVLEPQSWFAGHGPLYFKTLQLWAKSMGTSEFGLRALSAAFGGVTVCLAYAMGERLYDRRVAGIAAWLLATSPFFIWYSQEVRYVMLMMAAALLAMYAFHKALTAKGSAWWLLQCGSLILMLGVFIVNIFLLAAQGIYLVCSAKRRHLLRRWVAFQLVVFTLFVWWANAGHIAHLGGYWQRLLVHVTSSPQTRASIQPTEHMATGSAREFTIMGIPYTFFTFSTGYSLGPSLTELHISRSLKTVLAHTPVIAVCGLLFGTLFFIGLKALRQQPDTAVFLTAWLVVPLMGTFAVSALIPEMPYNVRYVAMSFPAYILILAGGIANFRRRLLQGALLAAVLLISALSLANYYFNPRYSREDTRGAAQYLETAVGARDVIVLVGSGYVFRHYYKPASMLVSLTKEMINDEVALARQFEDLDKDHEHLWLVSIRSWRVDPQGITQALLNKRYTTMARHELSGVDIRRYQLH